MTCPECKDTGRPKPTDSRFQDLTGQRFGRLVVVAYEGRDCHRTSIWRCVCDCGNEAVTKSRELKSGDTKSCGCRNREVAAMRFAIHGLSHRPEHGAWSQMIQRCTNERTKAYADYGGRGIRVCQRWLSFQQFIEDMGPRPSPEHTIDRIDNNGNYEPENCRWATVRQQRRNTRANRLLTMNSQTKTAIEWCEELGMPSSVVYARIHLGWDDERVLTTPVRRMRHVS